MALTTLDGWKLLYNDKLTNSGGKTYHFDGSFNLYKVFYCVQETYDSESVYLRINGVSGASSYKNELLDIYNNSTSNNACSWIFLSSNSNAAGSGEFILPNDTGGAYWQLPNTAYYSNYSGSHDKVYVFQQTNFSWSSLSSITIGVSGHAMNGRIVIWGMK